MNDDQLIEMMMEDVANIKALRVHAVGHEKQKLQRAEASLRMGAKRLNALAGFTDARPRHVSVPLDQTVGRIEP